MRSVACDPYRAIGFPFAFVRSPEAHLWQLQRFALVDAGAAPYRAALKLTGKQRFFRARLHFELEDGKWLSDEHGSRLDPYRAIRTVSAALSRTRHGNGFSSSSASSIAGARCFDG